MDEGQQHGTALVAHANHLQHTLLWTHTDRQGGEEGGLEAGDTRKKEAGREGSDEHILS